MIYGGSNTSEIAEKFDPPFVVAVSAPQEERSAGFLSLGQMFSREIDVGCSSTKPDGATSIM
jgi:hypothetical protein